MLDADRALKFAGAAGGALEHSLLRNVGTDQGLIASGSKFVEVIADTQNNLFWVKFLSRVVSGTVFGAAAAFDAGEGLQGRELCDVFAGVQAEIVVARQRWDLAEAWAFQENGHRTEYRSEE